MRGGELERLDGDRFSAGDAREGEIDRDALSLPMGASLVGDLREVHADLGILLLEHREKHFANADPLVCVFSIGWIEDKGDAKALEVGLEVRARCVDERADDAIVARGFDPPESVKSPAPEDAVKDSLRLIVLMMPDGDFLGAPLTFQREERLIARLSGGALERRAALDLDLELDKFDGPLRRFGLDQAEFVLGLLAETMVDARGDELEIELGPETMKNIEKRHRVGAARAGKDHALAAIE